MASLGVALYFHEFRLMSSYFGSLGMVKSSPAKKQKKSETLSWKRPKATLTLVGNFGGGTSFFLKC